MSNDGDAQKEAYKRFLAKNYDQCSASLHALLSSTPRGDPKIQHNVAICEYFKGGCQDSGKFLQDLEKLGRSTDRDRQHEHAESVAAVERLAAQRAQAYRPLCLEFEGHEYVRYNEAVVHFHQRQYAEAVEKLVSIFHNKGQIASLLYIRVVLLLLSCTLAQLPRGEPAVAARAEQLLASLDDLQPAIEQHDAAAASAPAAGGGGEAQGAPNLRLADHALLLRAHHAAVGGDAERALELLGRLDRAAGWWPLVLYMNNLGVLHLSAGKPHLAALYLARAIDAFEKSRPRGEGSQSGSGMGLYPSMAAVYYNNGICLMLRGKYTLAHKSFVIAAPLLKDTPTLWLRLAQCCVRHYEAQLAAEQRKAHAEREAAAAVPATANGPARDVAVLPTPDVLQPASLKVDSGDDLSLIFAEKCLRNAHYLLLRRFRGRKAPPAEGEEKAADGGAEAEASEEQCLRAAAKDDPEVSAVLQAVYSNMTYVALCLNNPAVALTAAQKLLSLPVVFKEHRVVALTYSTEAYVRLGRSEEALALLKEVDLQEIMTSEPSGLTLSCAGKANPTSADLPAFGACPVLLGSSEEARTALSHSQAASLFTNLAAAHIMSAKYARAQHCLDQFRPATHDSPIANLLQVYLHLALGKKDKAIEELQTRNIAPPYYSAAP